MIDALRPNGRQIKTSAHPLVEMKLMRQGGRTLVHLINLSGHSQTGYFAPLPVRDIQVEVAGQFTRVRLLRGGGTAVVRRSGAYAGFTVPELKDYEVAVLE